MTISIILASLWWLIMHHWSVYGWNCLVHLSCDWYEYLYDASNWSYLWVACSLQVSSWECMLLTSGGQAHRGSHVNLVLIDYTTMKSIMVNDCIVNHFVKWYCSESQTKILLISQWCKSSHLHLYLFGRELYLTLSFFFSLHSIPILH